MANRKAKKHRLLLPGIGLVTLVICLCLVGIGIGSAASGESPPVRASQQPHPEEHHPRISANDDHGITSYVHFAWFWAAIAAFMVTGIVSLLMARALLRRQKAEAALKRSESQFRQIAENIRDVFWVGTPDFRRLDYVSPAYETIWGHSCESLYKDPLSWMESLFPHDRQVVLDFIDKNQTIPFSDGAAFPDFRIVRPDGDIRWIHARMHTIKDGNGRDDLIVGIGQDVTRSKFFDASLRESEEKWRSLMENSPDHIMLMDLDGHVLFANRSFMGMKKADLMGKSIEKVIPFGFGQLVQSCRKKVVLLGKPDSCCVESMDEQGSKTYFELRMGPVSVNNQTVAVAVNSTEITDRVNQEKALQESEAFHRTFFENSPPVFPCRISPLSKRRFNG